MSILQDKKIIIEVLKKPNGGVYKNMKDEGSMLTGTTRTIKVPMNLKTSRLVDPLNKEEREFFEKELGVSLDPNKPAETNFWNNDPRAIVLIRKVDRGLGSAQVVLDLNDSMDYLKYKIALCNTERVASSYAERDNKPGQYEFVIKDLDAELIEEIDHTKKFSDVMEYLISIKSSNKKLWDFIRIYGGQSRLPFKMNTAQQTDWLYNELVKYAQIKSNVDTMYKIVKLDDTTLYNKVFLQDALSAGAILKEAGKYKLPAGDIIGYTEEEVISFLNEKINQEIKMKIKALIDAETEGKKEIKKSK